MLRICILGDSHLAALKLAWDEIGSQFADIQVTCFGGRGGALQELRIEDGELLPQSEQVRESMLMTSGGLDRIVLKNYDVFVLHALGFSFDRLVENLISGEIRRPGLCDIRTMLGKSTACELAQQITARGKPALISVQPFFSEQILEKKAGWRGFFGRQGTRDKKWAAWRELVNKQGLPKSELLSLLELWEQACPIFGALSQPPETIKNRVFTRAEYCKDSVRLVNLSTRHPATDYKHMNRVYGEAVIRAMIARCRELAGSGNQNPPARETHSADAPDGLLDAKQHPYVNLPDRAFWRRTAGKPALEINDWYRKKFSISGLSIAAAGSCFAQHIGRRLRQQGFPYIDAEPAPPHLSPEDCVSNGYGIYSARYGNIYTSRQLVQLLQRAQGDFVPHAVYWETEGGYVDPFRPSIQKVPFATIDEVVAARDRHLAAVRTLFERTQVFIFTLGLTESWVSLKDGAVFPVAPGVAGGRFDDTQYRFLNLGFDEVMGDLLEFIDRVRRINRQMKFIFTVSPVPLMATASDRQIIVATEYSKSVLRAVAGQLADQRDDVDYFPSFEIISSHIMRGRFYEPDLRTVSESGVDHVMKLFFAEHVPPVVSRPEPRGGGPAAEEDIVCDEELLEAFAGKSCRNKDGVAG